MSSLSLTPGFRVDVKIKDNENVLMISSYHNFNDFLEFKKNYSSKWSHLKSVFVIMRTEDYLKADLFWPTSINSAKEIDNLVLRMIIDIITLPIRLFTWPIRDKIIQHPLSKYVDNIEAFEEVTIEIDLQCTIIEENNTSATKLIIKGSFTVSPTPNPYFKSVKKFTSRKQDFKKAKISGKEEWAVQGEDAERDIVRWSRVKRNYDNFLINKKIIYETDSDFSGREDSEDILYEVGYVSDDEGF